MSRTDTELTQMTTDEIMQVVGAIYQATLDVTDQREALDYIHECAGLILDSVAPVEARRTRKLWVSGAVSSYGNDYGPMLAVVAETREEAIAKARTELSKKHSYVPHQKFADALLDNIESMDEITSGVIVDWGSVT